MPRQLLHRLRLAHLLHPPYRQLCWLPRAVPLLMSAAAAAVVVVACDGLDAAPT